MHHRLLHPGRRPPAKPRAAPPGWGTGAVRTASLAMGSKKYTVVQRESLVQRSSRVVWPFPNLGNWLETVFYGVSKLFTWWASSLLLSIHLSIVDASVYTPQHRRCCCLYTWTSSMLLSIHLSIVDAAVYTPGHRRCCCLYISASSMLLSIHLSIVDAPVHIPEHRRCSEHYGRSIDCVGPMLLQSANMLILWYKLFYNSFYWRQRQDPGSPSPEESRTCVFCGEALFLYCGELVWEWWKNTHWDSNL